MTQVYLPTSLKGPGSGTFNDNPLTEVIIPYGVTSASSGGKYSYGLFEDIPSLKAVYVPDTVKSMGAKFISGSDNCIVYCSEGSCAEEFCNKTAYLMPSTIR